MICYLGLGANLGEREQTLRRAIERVKKISNVKLLRVSSFYETEPWGVEGQPNFINAAIKISTELEPLALLDELQRVESELGRVRKKKWEPRPIDIDILLIEGREIFSERLTVPHPFLFRRDFALVPLMEIFPTLDCKLNGDKISRVTGSPIDYAFKLVACVDKNFGLGRGGKLLFKIPEDLKNFRRLTLNHTIILGRRTLETFPNGQPLDGRRNIILSRSREKILGAEVVSSLEKLFGVLNVAEENFVVGGEQIFNELISYAAEIFLTVVDAEEDADKFFPNIDEFILHSVKKFSGFEIRRYTR
ncbi:MAG: 2-amino-4-hydroxy-6-hydroxymethyldihydropteridine diphosphokinase [Selenomonadaceae bacterium]|nr:2-amino-4-hydroxy-6-hydroxymethyldihydropteridine diphosphokinase [Selenomonadaceae bacterium]